jgi:hypothetical protein
VETRGRGGEAGRRRARDPLRPSVSLPGLALAAAGSAAAGLFLGVPWLLPVLNAAPAYAVMVAALRRGRRAAAAGLMLWWAACLGGATTLLAAADPWGTAAATILNGPAYLDEMRPWVATGQGCESDPACFVRLHALHAGAFAALALATGSAAALLMGSVLMNYMAYFVGRLAASSSAPLATALLGWFPWSLVRVAAFVVLGVVLAEPLLVHVARAPSRPGRARWILAAAGGLVLDVLLKAALAPSWAALLRASIGG